uniref:PHD-type domain-containing protein n=1 Tax=Caenorhabditis japonica TaxID=281687 RepID=A0A8R1HP23_CAEJA
MSDVSENDIQIVEEETEQKEETPETPEKLEPFEADVYMAKIIEFLDSSDSDASERLKTLVAQTWSRTDEAARFLTEACNLDSGGVSKFAPNVMMAGAKRIAGTQRLMYAPPAAMNNMEKVGLTKKPRKQVPVIDDSLYCTTDQPCSTCQGVSQAGNQVLICKRCKDCFHMKCSQPPVSVEEASDPKFAYLCKTCLVTRKVLDSSHRSRSPSPAFIDAKKQKGVKR